MEHHTVTLFAAWECRLRLYGTQYFTGYLQFFIPNENVKILWHFKCLFAQSNAKNSSPS